MPSLSDIFNQMIGKGSTANTEAGATPESMQSDGEGEDNVYTDKHKVAQRILDHIKDCDKLRWSFERLWFRSVLYYLGNQWLTWDARSRRWREKKLRKWVPKPVTNRYASTVDSICSAIQATKVLPSAWPATQDPEDQGAANVADRVIEVIAQEMRSERVRGKLAKLMTLCGDAFAYVYYDKGDDTLGKTQIDSLQCTQCGMVAQPLEFAAACPQCGNTGDPMPAMNAMGQPQGEKYPVGRMACDVLSPLELYINLDIVDMNKQQKFTIARSYSIEQVKKMYPGDVSKSIAPDTASATRTAQYFMEALAFSTEDSGYNLTGASHRDRVTLFTHIELPSEDYPEGIHCVMCADETVLELGPSPHFEELADGQKEYYRPIIKFGYESVPGRLYSKTPAYDLIPKQDQLNRLEALIEMSVMKGVYVNWLLPTGSSIAETSGEPGVKIRYTPTGTGGHKPEVITTAPFPAILLEWKTQIQQDFEELGGTFDALKGNVPRGVSAGYAIQLLTERSYGRFASVFAEWELSWVDYYSVALKMFRTYATEPRLRKIKGSTGGWEIEAFKNSSLKGSVDLKVEGSATKPRSKLAEQALVESLAKMGIINTQDPEQKFQIAQMFGMSHVLGVHDDDVRHAAGEWDALLKWNPPADPMTGEPFIDPNSPEPFPAGGPEEDDVFDNHAVHVTEHRKPTRTDVWRQLPPWKQLFWKNHTIKHMIAMQPVIDGAAGAASGNVAKNEPGKPTNPTSKAHEQSDKTMDTLRTGGSVAMGSGGKNQF